MWEIIPPQNFSRFFVIWQFTWDQLVSSQEMEIQFGILKINNRDENKDGLGCLYLNRRPEMVNMRMKTPVKRN